MLTTISLVMLAISLILTGIVNLRTADAIEDIQQRLLRLEHKKAGSASEPTLSIDGAAVARIMNEAIHDNDEE